MANHLPRVQKVDYFALLLTQKDNFNITLKVDINMRNSEIILTFM